MKAYRHLVRHALREGTTVSVWDGEEWQVKRSSSFKAIVDAIESVDDSTLVFRTENGTQIGTAYVIASLADDETVADNSDNPWFEDWSARYEETLK
jgi:hypothetical protein